MDLQNPWKLRGGGACVKQGTTESASSISVPGNLVCERLQSLRERGNDTWEPEQPPGLLKARASTRAHSFGQEGGEWAAR